MAYVGYTGVIIYRRSSKVFNRVFQMVFSNVYVRYIGGRV